MKQLPFILTLIGCLTLSFTIEAQDFNTMEYSYDEAGNRVSRSFQIAHYKTAPITRDSSLLGIDSIAADTEALDVAKEATSRELIPNVYPNPTADYITIELLNNMLGSQLSPTTLFIYDSKQALVYSTQTVSNKIEVNMSNLSSGLYMLVVQSTKNRHWFNIQKK